MWISIYRLPEKFLGGTGGKFVNENFLTYAKPGTLILD